MPRLLGGDEVRSVSHLPVLTIEGGHEVIRRIDPGDLILASFDATGPSPDVVSSPSRCLSEHREALAEARAGHHST